MKYIIDTDILQCEGESSENMLYRLCDYAKKLDVSIAKALEAGNLGIARSLYEDRARAWADYFGAWYLSIES
jgi:hypothetical protein